MSYKTARKELAAKMGDAPPQFACNRCRGPATGPMLSALGGTCGECFAAYCRDPIATRLPPPVVIDVDAKHPHAWAHRLRARRNIGAPLAKAQRDCLAAFERREAMLQGLA